MKKGILNLVAIIFLSVNTEGLTQESIGLKSGIYYAELLNRSLDGDASYTTDAVYAFGIRYTNNLTTRLALETGLDINKTKISIEPTFIGVPVETIENRLVFLSIPLITKLSFRDHFFTELGPLIDLQLSEGDFDSQSGIGYMIGLGMQKVKGSFSYILSSSFRRHAVIAFDKQRNHQKLTELGLQFSILYRL